MLFSFRYGAQGFALLLLRNALAFMLVSLGAGYGNLGVSGLLLVPPVLAIAFLCIGFLTTWTASFCAVAVVIGTVANPVGQRDIGIEIATICLCVAVLGPGAYSLDALRYGRPRRVFPPES